MAALLRSAKGLFAHVSFDGCNAFSESKKVVKSGHRDVEYVLLKKDGPRDPFWGTGVGSQADLLWPGLDGNRVFMG